MMKKVENFEEKSKDEVKEIELDAEYEYDTSYVEEHKSELISEYGRFWKHAIPKSKIKIPPKKRKNSDVISAVNDINKKNAQKVVKKMLLAKADKQKQSGKVIGEEEIVVCSPRDWQCMREKVYRGYLILVEALIETNDGVDTNAVDVTFNSNDEIDEVIADMKNIYPNATIRVHFCGNPVGMPCKVFEV